MAGGKAGGQPRKWHWWSLSESEPPQVQPSSLLSDAEDRRSRRPACRVTRLMLFPLSFERRDGANTMPVDGTLPLLPSLLFVICCRIARRPAVADCSLSTCCMMPCPSFGTSHGETKDGAILRVQSGVCRPSPFPLVFGFGGRARDRSAA